MSKLYPCVYCTFDDLKTAMELLAETEPKGFEET